MNCIHCAEVIPAGACFCPWCGGSQRPREANSDSEKAPEPACPVCGARDSAAGPLWPQPILTPDLESQRQRFIAALELRQRLREAAAFRSAPALARERILMLACDLGEEGYLVLNNGLALKHVPALASCLDQLPIEIFRSHVSSSRNDFAEWIAEVFEDRVLAARIKGIEEPRRLQLELYRYLAGRDPGDPA